MLKEISIEIIRKCPNKCVHCSSCSSKECGEIIPVEKFKEIIDGAKALGLNTVCFSGGEPFLHPDIVEMIDYAYENKLNSYIYSSGIYLDSANKKCSIPKELLDKISGKVTKIIFNIEAIDEYIYDAIMGTRGCFHFLEQSIKDALDRKIVVEGHFVPMKLNKGQITQVVDFCEKLGVSKVSFLRLVMHGRALDNRECLLLSQEELKEIEELLIELRKSSDSYIRIGVPFLGETREAHCEAANGKLNIKYDGNVYPCEVFKNNRVRILEDIKPGNIFEEGIEEIYRDSEYLQKVRALVRQFHRVSSCENCIGQYYISL